MTKRIIMMVLVLSMAITLFSGCEGKEGNGETTTKAPPTPYQGWSTSPKDGMINVSLGIWPTESDQANVDMFKGFAKKLWSEYDNVNCVAAHYTYTPQTFGAEYDAKKIPTIFETWFTEPRKLVKNGWVQDIDKFAQENGWELADSVADILTINDKLYALPRDTYALGLHINVSMFEKSKLVDEDGIPTYPKTWEELGEMGQKIREEQGRAGITFLASDASSGWHFTNMAWSYGAELQYQDENGKWHANLNSPECLEAMQMVYDLKWKYNAINDDATTSVWETGWTNIANNVSAMYIGANDGVIQYGQKNVLLPENLMIAPLPAGSAGSVSLAGGTPWMFPKYATEEEVKYALEFLKIWGQVPSEDLTSAKDGMDTGLATLAKENVPVIPRFPTWNNDEFNKMIEETVEEYSNVDMRMYEDYFNWINTSGTIHAEYSEATQDMYMELTKVIKEVVTNQNCYGNIQSLLDEHNANFQKILDNLDS